MTVILIALVPAFIAFLIGVASNNRLILFVTCVASGIFGAVTGSPVYTLVDIGFSVGAFAIGFATIRNNHPKRRDYTRVGPTPKAANKSDSWGSIGVVVALLGLYLYGKTADKPAPLPPPASQAPTRYVATPAQEPSPQYKKHIGTDIRQCLNLPTDAEISRCADGAR